MSDLVIEGLTVQYGKRTVLHHVTLPKIQAGSVVMVLGPNGSGKSSMLKAISGLHASLGKLELSGNNLRQLPFASRAQQIGYLPQSLPQGAHLNVLESVKIAGGFAGSTEDWQKIVLVLQQLEIESLALRYLDELSGGQKQLVGLAQSLVREPQVWLLDEPLSALDLHHQFQVMEVIKQETQRRQLISLVIVHDINIALRYADQVLFLKQGHLVRYGTPQQVITAATLEEIYRVNATIEYSATQRPYVLIDGISRSLSSEV